MSKFFCTINQIRFNFVFVVIFVLLQAMTTLHFYGHGFLTLVYIILIALFSLLALMSGRLSATVFVNKTIIGFILFSFLLMHVFSRLEGEPLLSWARMIHTVSFVIFLYLLFPRKEGFFLNDQWMSYFLLFTFIACVSLLNDQALPISERQVFLLQFCFFVWCYYVSRPVSFDELAYFLMIFSLWSLMFVFNFTAGYYEEVNAAVSRVHYMLGHMMFGWAVFSAFKKYLWGFNKIVWPVLFSVTICFFSVLVKWYAVSDPVTFDWFYQPPLFGHIRHMAYFLCFASVVSIFWFFNVNFRYCIISVFMVFISLFLLFWNGGRGAILAAFIGCIFVILSRSFNLIRSIIFLGLIALSLSISFLYRVESRGVGWFNALWRSDKAEGLNDLSSGRLWIWSELWPYIKNRLWTGWGGDAFISVWPHELRIIQAHNFLIQLLLEWGVIITSIILYLIFHLVVKGCINVYTKNCLVSPVLVLGLMVTVSMMVLSIFDGVFYYGMPGSFLVIGLSLIAAGLVRS